MNRPHRSIITLLCLLAFTLTTAPLQAGEKSNPAFWKITVNGDFATVLEMVKTQLQADQFQITAEENLARGLANNQQALGKDWNTIGFKETTSVHFCSLVFNKEVFNLNMDWSIMCPFKLVAYSMKKSPKQVTIVTVRPTYLLKHDSHPRAKEVSEKIERRIIASLEAAVK